MRFSVLDQSPVSMDSTPEEAMRQSIELAKWTENLGFHRYWVAEHHNTSGLAGAAPEVLIARLAAETKTMKIGSGGVLLPQYSPYKVAETFKVLEGLSPGRINLGIGNSPGGSLETRLALTDGIRKSLSDFPKQVETLIQYLYRQPLLDFPLEGVHATPFTQTAPDLYLLGIREQGSQLAAKHGTGFVFGHFINPDDGEEATHYYRDHFQPSTRFPKPKTIVCIFVVCGETKKEAEQLALTQDAWLLSVGKKGADTRIPSESMVKNRVFSVEELKKITHNRRRMIVGTPDLVKEEIHELRDVYEADEFMVITNIHDFVAKKHSYELLAEALFD